MPWFQLLVNGFFSNGKRSSRALLEEDEGWRHVLTAKDIFVRSREAMAAPPPASPPRDGDDGDILAADRATDDAESREGTRTEQRRRAR